MARVGVSLFVGVSLASFYGSQDSSGDYFAIYFQLADVLKRSTCQVVCLTAIISAGLRERFGKGGLTLGMMSPHKPAGANLGCDKKAPR
jgi:hypothetical protein